MKQPQTILNKQRLDCQICNYRVDPNDETAFYTFLCSIISLMKEKFKVAGMGVMFRKSI